MFSNCVLWLLASDNTDISLFITLSTNQSVSGVMVSIAAFQAVDETDYLDVTWQKSNGWFLPSSRSWLDSYTF